MRRILSGVIGYPHFGQRVLSDAITFSRLIFCFRGTGKSLPVLGSLRQTVVVVPNLFDVALQLSLNPPDCQYSRGIALEWRQSKYHAALCTSPNPWGVLVDPLPCRRFPTGRSQLLPCGFRTRELLRKQREFQHRMLSSEVLS